MARPHTPTQTTLAQQREKLEQMAGQQKAQEWTVAHKENLGSLASQQPLHALSAVHMRRVWRAQGQSIAGLWVRWTRRVCQEQDTKMSQVLLLLLLQWGQKWGLSWWRKTKRLWASESQYTEMLHNAVL